MAEGSTKQYNEDLVREVIRKTKTRLSESIYPDKILDDLYSERVINMGQFDLLETYRNTKGRVYVVGQLLQMVMKNEVQATGFMKTVSQQLPWVEKEILEGVERFESGEWKVPGQIHIEGNYVTPCNKKAHSINNIHSNII